MKKDRYPSPHSVWRRAGKAVQYASLGRPGERQRRDGGFTLLELIVAMTLLGLIVALLFGGLRFGARVWEAADQRIDESSELQVVQSFMRRRLGQATPLALPDSRVTRRVAFEGTPESVTFAALMPAHLGLGGFYWLSFYADESSDGRRLVASWRLFQPERDAFAEAEAVEKTVLVDRISAVEFSYFGPRDRGQSPEWRDRWEEIGSLPTLVSVRVSFAGSDGRSWPGLVVAPMLNRNLGGSFDPTSELPTESVTE